ncbi:MAG: hypothetical protein EBU93_08025, partial [Chlamydiae bacterium]|nr:hypothetical protein [Chlamydiota bacterium]
FAGMDMDSRVSQLESQMKEVRTQTENETHGALTASNAPQLKEPTDFFLGIGLVYQNAILTQTDFGYTTSDLDILPLSGQMLERNSKWALGINAQAGYNFKHDNSYVALNNSYFNISSSKKASFDLPSHIVPSRTSSLIQDFEDGSWLHAASTVSNWDLTYDLLGLEIGRDFFISRYFSIKPSFGLLTSWIWLQNNISYTGVDLGLDSDYVNDKSNFWGIGPQAGTVLGLGLMNGFTLFADVKGSLMYGRLRVEHSENYSADADAQYELKAYSHIILPYVTATIGLSYDVTTEGKGNHFKIRAGYNTQYFIGANQMLYPVNISDGYEFKREEGSLQTSGLVVDATWSF